MDTIRWIVVIGYTVLAFLLLLLARRRPVLRPVVWWFLSVALNGVLFQAATIIRAAGIHAFDTGVYNTWSAIVRVHTIGVGIGVALFYLRGPSTFE